jgi:hypothetical protein
MVPNKTNPRKIDMFTRGFTMNAASIRATLRTDLPKRQHRLPIAWKAREGSMNLQFSGLQSGHYSTDAPQYGWVLRSRGKSGTWNDRTFPVKSQYRVGDHIFLRETFAVESTWGSGSRGRVVYRADCDKEANTCPFPRAEYGEWMRPQHLRQAYARPDLFEITGVRCERLRSITVEDCLRCGIANLSEFGQSWDALHGDGAFEAGGWCWVYDYERLGAQG